METTRPTRSSAAGLLAALLLATPAVAVAEPEAAPTDPITAALAARCRIGDGLAMLVSPARPNRRAPLRVIVVSKKPQPGAVLVAQGPPGRHALQGLTRGRGPLSFHWDGRLGLDYDTDMDAAHWARDFYSEASADDPRAPLRALEIRTTGGPGLRFLLPQGEARLHLGPLLQYSRSSRRLTERLEDEYRVSPLGSSGRLGAQLGGVLELELRNGMRLGPRLDLRLSRQAALSFSELTEEQLADDPSDEQLLRAEHAWTWIELLPALDFSLELAGLQPAALQLQLGFPYLVFRHRGGESLELLRQVYGDGVDTQDHSTLLLFSLGAQGRFGP